MQYKIRPKLRGGSAKTELHLIMGNIKGLPNNRNLKHKIKDVNSLLKNKDGAILVETATTK